MELSGIRTGHCKPVWRLLARSRALLLAAGAPEGADGEPGEEDGEGGVEGQVVVAPSCDFVDLPGVDRESEGEESEEEAGDLEDEDAGGVREGADKSRGETARALGEALGTGGMRGGFGWRGLGGRGGGRGCSD